MRKRAIEINEQGEITASPANKNEEGYIEKRYITPANAHESKHFEELLDGLTENTTVYADKGYESKANQEQLQTRKLTDGIMRRAQRNTAQSQEEKERNKALSKTRYVVEQTFGTLHCKFQHKQACYFGLIKVAAQSHLKAICVNLLKAGNRVNVSVPA